MSDNIGVHITDGVGVLTIKGSNRLNALDLATAQDLFTAVVELGEDDTVRCIGLVGDGDAFCVGADLSPLNGDERDAVALRRLASTLHDSIVQLHQADIPIVTAVNGIAAGAGFSLALVGDVVLMSDDAELDYAYSRIGLTGDGGSTFSLPRLVGLRRAKEIMLLDETIGPERAVEIGLATETTLAADLSNRFDEFTSRLADGPTGAFGATKRLMAESFERELSAQLAAETDAIARATRTEDYTEGYAAFFDDTDPEFSGK